MNPKKLVRSLLPKSLTDQLAAMYRWVRGFVLYYALGMPFYKVRLIGVTGTNGKTTTTSYINSILKAAGYSTALNTTVNTEINGEYVRNKSHLTSGTTKQIYGFIKQAKKAGVDFVIMEVTSQALHQHRHWGLKYEAAAITNLSYEHMEYHKNMDDYAAAKAMLFQTSPKAIALNMDDEWYQYFDDLPMQTDAKKVSYGDNKDANIRISQANVTTKGSKFTLDFEGKKQKVSTSLVGKFNVYNATTAASICYTLGLKLEDIAKGVAALQWVDGRVNPIDEGQDFAVFTDYSHTPDGLASVLGTIKDMTKGRLILVQSTMDGRDPEKWPKLGEAAAKYADSIFVCDEEAFKLPREVMRQAIIDGIVAGGGKDKYEEIEDRQTAIETAVASAKKNDTVLIVPFGHQTEMTFYGKTIYWDEREVASNAVLKSMGKKPRKVKTGTKISHD